jgi:hypothetical protein
MAKRIRVGDIDYRIEHAVIGCSPLARRVVSISIQLYEPDREVFASTKGCRVEIGDDGSVVFYFPQKEVA